MKKFGQIVLVLLLSVGMFTGCGESSSTNPVKYGL